MNYTPRFSTTLYLPLSANDEAHIDSVVALGHTYHLPLDPEFLRRVVNDTKASIARSFVEQVLVDFADPVSSVSVIGAPYMLKLVFEPVEVSL